MNIEVFEALLREPESTSIDFKRDQYRFYGGSESDKGGLLKDILAFANAWRRSAAYILIGVDEVVGGRGRIQGVTGHLKDNDLQQFINSKTQRPIVFSYQAFEAEGKQVGIIEIPLQKRPFFLTKTWGPLTAKTVYVRRGSSTAEADPDEIASMGAPTSNPSAAAPTLSATLADVPSRTALKPEIELASLSLNALDHASLEPPPSPWSFLARGLNRDYYKELVEYISDHSFLVGVGFVVHNSGPNAALGVLLKASIPKRPGVRITDIPPSAPSRYLLGVVPHVARASGPVPQIDNVFDRWELSIPFGTVVPGEHVWSSDSIYVGSEQNTNLDFTIRILAENLPQPLEQIMTIKIRCQKRDMTLEDIERHEEE